MDDVRDELTDSPVTMGSAPAAPSELDLESDRRRPGRISPVPAELVPLLRRQTLLSDAASLDTAPAVGLADDAADDIDGTRVFAGIVIGAVLATPFWLLLGIVVWWALR
jgi:hypothetical protein